MSRKKLFKCVGIGLITIIVVITVLLIVKRQYYIRRVDPSTEESRFIEGTGIDDIFSVEFRIKSPNGFPLEKEFIFQRYIYGKLKEEESFNINAVLYPNMKLKVDEGKIYFAKIGFEKEVGFELYHFMSTTEWAKTASRLESVKFPLKSESLAYESLAYMEWEFGEYRDIKLDNEYIFKIVMFEENGIKSLNQEVLENASRGDKESLEIILKRYPIVEILKIKISSMENQ